MSDEPTPELRALAATLFAAGRAERPGAALGRRLAFIEPHSAGQGVPRRHSVAPELRVGRSPLLLWLAAAALLAGGAGLWLRGESEAPLRISAEREPHRVSSTSGERAEAVAPPAQLEAPPAASVAEATTRADGAHAAPLRPKRAQRRPPVESERSTPPSAEPSNVATPAPRAVEPPSAAAPAVAPPAAAPLTLLAELELLKRARAALRSGDGAQALELLEQHAHQRGSNGLAAEATLLRIETLSALGRQAEASELATRFVGASPNSALSDRARSFIRRSPPKTP